MSEDTPPVVHPASPGRAKLLGVLLCLFGAVAWAGALYLGRFNAATAAISIAVAVAATFTLVFRGLGMAAGIKSRRALEQVGLVLGASLGLGLGVWASLELQRPRWRLYASVDGGFSIDLPSDPSDISREQPAPDGPVRVHALECRPTFTAWSYGVSWLDRHDPDAANAPAKVLAVIQRETLEKLKGTLVAERDLALEGNPGRQFELKASGRRVVERFYMVRSRLYFLCIDAPEIDMPADGDRFRGFLDSFKLDQR